MIKKSQRLSAEERHLMYILASIFSGISSGRTVLLPSEEVNVDEKDKRSDSFEQYIWSRSIIRYYRIYQSDRDNSHLGPFYSITKEANWWDRFHY